MSDEKWERLGRFRYAAGSTFGAFIDGELAGTTLSARSALAIPGGRTVPAAAVTAVGVRADRTRRGALTGLMRAQLSDVRDRGEVVAMLHASEGGIYERFGYGVATRTRKVVVPKPGTRLRAQAPEVGRVRFVSLEEARSVLPAVYERIGLSRPGMIERWDTWWDHVLEPRDSTAPCSIVVHTDAEGVDDGYAVFAACKEDYRFGSGTVVLQVSDVQAVSESVGGALWRFLLGVDLVDRVDVIDRPVDEPVEWWLTDRRQCQVHGVDDDLWVRLVDVPAALAARDFRGAEPVRIEVRDELFPDNAGVYEIGADGVRRTDRPAQLSMDVAMLAVLYLGDVRPSALAAAHLVDVLDPAATVRADEVFATSIAPWCGTGF